MVTNKQLTDVDRRTVLKLTSGAALGAIASAGSAAAQQQVDVELEGTLQDVDTTNNRITVMGVPVDVQNATFSAPTTALEFSQVGSSPAFPERSSPGFLGGTATVVGTVSDTGGVVNASSVFVEVAEHVVVGPVTRNTVPEGGSLADGAFEVLGTQVEAVDDPRMPLVAILEDTNQTVDIGTIPTGSLTAVEGYLGSPDTVGDQETLYAHTLEASQGASEGPASTTITRAECDGDDGELEVRGTSSAPNGTISLYDHHTNELLATADITPSADNPNLGEFRIRADLGSCPSVVRAENSNGSQDVANVEIN